MKTHIRVSQGSAWSMALLVVLVAGGLILRVSTDTGPSPGGVVVSSPIPSASIPQSTLAPQPVLPADVQAELAALPSGTRIVPCNSSVAVFPEDVRPAPAFGFFQMHPGFRYLSHGYCADDPSATPAPFPGGGTP